ncbi:MAG: tetratricopeptide repeat protein [Phycisphaerales bacterium]|nr:tetratricopeptide repeat protein [Phycisphaerales bacterium]
MGLVLQERGEETSALRAFEQARDMLAELGNERAREIVGAHVNVARTRVHLSQFAEAERSVVEAEEALKRLGHDDPGQQADIAVVRSSLASAWKGDPAQAEAFTVDEVALRRRADQPAVLAGSLNNLAVMKVNRGKLDEALPLYEEAIGVASREYGEQHHITASLMENQANIYRMKKDYDTCLAHGACARHSRIDLRARQPARRQDAAESRGNRDHQEGLQTGAGADGGRLAEPAEASGGAAHGCRPGAPQPRALPQGPGRCRERAPRQSGGFGDLRRRVRADGGGAAADVAGHRRAPLHSG